MGKGKDLFGHYYDLGSQKGLKSKEYEYACVLFQALLMVGERKVYELLEEADETGQKLTFTYTEGATPHIPQGIVLAKP